MSRQVTLAGQAPAGQPTPGPWSIYMDNLNQFVVRKMYDDGQEAHVIARVRGSSEVPAIANARMIAASPDLLAALQEAVIAMSAATVHLPVNELPRIACNTAIANARAALSRATGSQP